MAETEPEVDFTKLPIDERCQHKNWKARVSGYESLTQLFTTQDDESSPVFSKYLGILRKFPVDSNAAAQEKGLAAVAVFVENASPSISSRVASEVITGIITKCLISPKARTKELAYEIVLMYIEVEKQEVVIEELLKGTENKSPKIVSCCISLLKESLRLFGPKVIKPTPLIKMITKTLEDRDKNVREESKQLTVEIYRWMKDVFKSQLTGLKPVQLTELEAEFEKIASEKAAPVRFLRSEQQRVQQEVVISGDVGDGQVVAPEPSEDIDPYDLLEPVEILNKLPANFYTDCESKKWAERKAALDSLQELLTPNPKIAAGDYGDLVKVLRNFIKKDTNINVVATSAKCMADLASRLRKAFHPYAHSTVAVIIEKLKEKKQNVVVALREAIDASMLSISLETVLEDVTGALANKNPQIKAETASFLTRQFAITSFTVLGDKKILKPLVASLLVTLNDMDASVRDAAAEAIGTVQKVVGEKAMLPYLQDVEAIKLTKIKEFCDKASVKYTAPAGGFRAVVVRPETAAAGKATIAPKPSSTRSMSVGELPGAPAKKKSPVKPVNKPVIAKSRTDCGLKKSKVTTSAPALEKPPPTLPAPAAATNRRASGQGLPKKPETESTEDVRETTTQPKVLKGSLTVTRRTLPKFVPKTKKEEVPPPVKHDEPVVVPSSNGHRNEESSEDDSSDGDAKTYVVKNGGQPRNKPMTKTIDISPKMDVALSLTMNQLTAQDPEDAIEAFNQLRQLFNKPDRAEALLGCKVDQIILMCNLQYRLCANKLADESAPKAHVIDVLRSVTSVLDSLFKHPTLKKKASRDVLRDLMPHIISIIIDSKLSDDEEGKSVARSVNVLGTCIIVSADPTNMMSALIKLLHDCVSGTINNSNPKTIEMIMKCIWKLVRFFPQYITNLNIDRILLDVHLFWKEFPTEYWKRDPARSDTPLRTVKTVVYFLVEEKGEDIMRHMSLIQDPNSSELVGYLGRAIKQLSKKKETAKPANAGPNKLSDRDAQQLSEIFAKLGSLNPNEGFAELHRFLASRPDFDFEKHLQSSSSEFFIRFVMEGLGKVTQSPQQPPRQSRSPMKEDIPPPLPPLRTTNGSSPALNGSRPTNGSSNGSSPVVDHTSPVKAQTPQSVSKLRPKLGSLSGNTSIPGPSSIPVAGLRFPRLPSKDQMSPGDVIDWFKSSHQALGLDSSKADASKIKKAGELSNTMANLSTEERLQRAQSMAEETRLKMNSYREKYHVNNS